MQGDKKSQWTGRHHANVTALPSPDTHAHRWWQEGGGIWGTLSFSWDCCAAASATASGEAAWHAAELYGTGDGDRGGRLLGWTLTLIGFVALHRQSGQSGLKSPLAISALPVTECEFPTISSHSTDKAAWKMDFFFFFN